MPLMKRNRFLYLTAALLLLVFPGMGEELPRPGYDNSIVISMTYAISNATPQEIAYMKSQFGNGLYAPLCVSSFLGVNLGWHVDISQAETYMANFKKTAEDWLKKARLHGVGLHIILNFGISRRSEFYENAKLEDLRNTQWYNDNNPIAATQWDYYDPGENTATENAFPFNHNKIDSSLVLTERAAAIGFTACALPTMSRYARKLRRHLDAKISACFAYLTALHRRYPDVLLIISAPGEAEMNSHPINNHSPLIEYFNDYSPFAIMEFRDWIRHEGLYAKSAPFDGQGYMYGGDRYRGANGLTNFNRDFKTGFTSWHLKYFDWSLSDPVDPDYTDYQNPDPKIIPANSYSFNSLLPQSGPQFISRGFDPPREMVKKGLNAFSDLWQLFRETMVRNYVLDVANAARNSGFPMTFYYTHQIPADYLFGTKPDPFVFPYLNTRYYSSASSLWTSFAAHDAGVGVTMYDVNVGPAIVRTSQYLLTDVSAMSGSWGIMEYNPEVTISDPSVRLSPPAEIYKQIIRVYGYRPHFISFFKWLGEDAYKFCQTNRGDGAKLFFDAIRDKARRSPSVMFTPKAVEGATVKAFPGSSAARLDWSMKIWPQFAFTWNHWGDFREFVIHRGDSPDFVPGAANELIRTAAFSFTDSRPRTVPSVWYRIAAVNKNRQVGPGIVLKFNGGGVTGTPVLKLSCSALNFGAELDGKSSSPQTIRVSNSGQGILQWRTVCSENWLTASPQSGAQGGVITISAHPAGKSPGVYSGTITISAPSAANSPQTIKILFTVYPKGKNTAPFGTFDTPTQGAKVMSSVPFTGWALDDTGIDSVKIFLMQNGRLLETGAALRVEGARSDITAAFPTHPENHKAGWGYMMLTNFLPNGGNGIYTFHAIATDITGRRQTLGIKTISCDNAHAVRPFGAIETPAPGGLAAGAKYRNWGWALTPPPNRIPIDGSTISVMVDGRFAGYANYNLYRSDVASLFPNYLNSQGAFGYLDLNPANYENGVHTIEWVVSDNAGNRDGIGSRYFIIDNSAATAQKNCSADANGVRPENAGTNWKPSGVTRRNAADSGVISIKKGYESAKTPQPLKAATDGSYCIELKETERLEIHLTPGFSAHRIISGSLRDLPVGSSCDYKNGIFCWLPGPGFLGEFRLQFNIPGAARPCLAIIIIKPRY